MKHILACLVAALCAGEVDSMTVHFQSYAVSCNGNDGGIIATVSGGTPPYTYSWNNGATENMVNGLAAGTYTLTVTDDTGAQVVENCVVGSWLGLGPIYPDLVGLDGLRPCTGQCNGGFRLHLPRIIGLYSFSTTPNMSYSELPEDEPGNWDGWVTYEFLGACAGTTVDITVTPGTGFCGSSFDQIPIDAMVEPIVSVGGITGSCNGADDGTIFGEITVSDPFESIWSVIVDDGQGAAFEPEPDGGFYFGTAPFQTYQLHPGDWSLVMLANNVIGSDQTTCVVQHPFTIPDLGTDCGTVSGTLHFETDVDCMQDGGEVGIPYQMLRVTPGPLYGITASDGSYDIAVPFGSYALEQMNTDAVQLCPPAGPVPFAVSNSSNAVVDLADSLITPFDMLAYVFSGLCRVGFPFSYNVHVNNTHAHPGEDITVSLDYDPIFTFISATAGVTVNDPGHIEWSIPTLLPFEHRVFSVSLQVPPDPGLTGTMHGVSCSATSITSEPNTLNNSHSTSHTVVSSFDPNDKQAFTSSGQIPAVYLLDVDEWIDYVIRFQNTGSDTAFNITVTDSIGPLLDLGSLEVMGASHAFTPEIATGSVVKFIFSDILLPDSTTNEPASHGYVVFRMKPVNSIAIGSTIDNAADIFFDFNDPVRTNTASLDVGITTGVRSAPPSILSVSPVPATDQLTIRAAGHVLTSIVVQSTDGRAVARYPGSTTVDISTLGPGLYVLQATTAEGVVMSTRFVKR